MAAIHSFSATQHIDEPVARAQIERVATHAREARSWTLHVPYAGRLVWRRFLSQLIECARQERLEFSYETAPHVFSVGLDVTVSGESSAVARFEFMAERLLWLYSPVAFS